MKILEKALIGKHIARTFLVKNLLHDIRLGQRTQYYRYITVIAFQSL